MMKKTFVAVLVMSFAVACASKKPTAAPSDKALERKDDAMGGATYGGNDQPRKDPPDPSAPR
jgi:hypothetical protein